MRNLIYQIDIIKFIRYAAAVKAHFAPSIFHCSFPRSTFLSQPRSLGFKINIKPSLYTFKSPRQSRPCCITGRNPSRDTQRINIIYTIPRSGRNILRTRVHEGKKKERIKRQWSNNACVRQLSRKKQSMLRSNRQLITGAAFGGHSIYTHASTDKSPRDCAILIYIYIYT